MTNETIQYIKEFYVDARKCGHPINSEDWQYIWDDLKEMGCNANEAKRIFDDFCNQ